MRHYADYMPVPKDFWCFETGDIFRSCSMCGTDLMTPGTNYLIEKAFRKKEPVFEYAMCFTCFQNLHDALSQKSRRLIENYFDEHIDLEERRNRMLSRYGSRPRSWIGHCMIKNTPRWQCEEHQIYGWFIDKDIVFTGMPYMLSGAVIDELLNLLSDETKGILDDFTGKLFGIDQPKGVLLI